MRPSHIVASSQVSIFLHGMVHIIEKKGLGLYLIQKGSALEKRRY